MAIKLLARDLYRSRKLVDRLEDELDSANEDARSAIEAQLRAARSEYAVLRKALDGKIGR